MKGERNRGLISQTYMLITAAVIVIGIFTYFTQSQIARRTVQSQIRTRAADATGELMSAIREYPAYSWLLSYWAEHADELEIEYDADFAGNRVTKEKCELFNISWQEFPHPLRWRDELPLFLTKGKRTLVLLPELWHTDITEKQNQSIVEKY